MDFTDDDKVALGEFCETILMSDQFNILTKHFETSTVSHLLSTATRDSVSREEFYSTIRGVRDFLSMMADFVMEKNRILNPQPEPSEEADYEAAEDAFYSKD